MFVSSEPTHLVETMCFSRCLLIAAQLCLFAHAAKQSLLFFDSEGQGHPQNLGSLTRAYPRARKFQISSTHIDNLDLTTLLQMCVMD